MGMDDKLHQKMFDDNLALIDTPLIATDTSTHYPAIVSTSLNTMHGVLTYPFNVSEFHHRHMAAAAAAGNEPPYDVIDTAIGYGGINGNSNGNGNGDVYYQSGQDVEVDLSTEIIKQIFQSTCHTALDTCREDPSCSSSLQPMLMHCGIHRCNRNACMTSLQAFYKGPHEDLNLDIAFCLCKKTTNRHDMCMIAQEQLHPVCAQRPPDSNNQLNPNGIHFHPAPACHIVAENCKEDRECSFTSGTTASASTSASTVRVRATATAMATITELPAK
ncbi:uncharacterized protein LOC119676352 [Teleopsis dalmanni]|uniref:uncharacterized protein LOC119676352 n=1 Tax=Teleopsis dalmanni TaxID=139649 RepID=UPI0018CDB8FE|nr:uncharacterized protein LOC119676352 [Teleopsis dalmanni]